MLENIITHKDLSNNIIIELRNPSKYRLLSCSLVVAISSSVTTSCTVMDGYSEHNAVLKPLTYVTAIT